MTSKEKRTKGEVFEGLSRLFGTRNTKEFIDTVKKGDKIPTGESEREFLGRAEKTAKKVLDKSKKS